MSNKRDGCHGQEKTLVDVMVESTFMSKFLRVPQYLLYRIYGICVEDGFGGFLSSPLDVVAHTVWQTRQGECVEGDTGNKRYGGHCRKDTWAIQGVDAIAERIFGSRFQVLHAFWY
jgi:hypothetical protein